MYRQAKAPNGLSRNRARSPLIATTVSYIDGINTTLWLFCGAKSRVSDWPIHPLQWKSITEIIQTTTALGSEPTSPQPITALKMFPLFFHTNVQVQMPLWEFLRGYQLTRGRHWSFIVSRVRRHLDILNLHAHTEFLVLGISLRRRLLLPCPCFSRVGAFA